MLVDGILTQLEFEQNLVENLTPFFDGHFVSRISGELIISIFDTFGLEFGEVNAELIEWWIWDAPQAGKNPNDAFIVVDDHSVDVKTPEQLYDFLIGEI